MIWSKLGFRVEGLVGEKGGGNDVTSCVNVVTSQRTYLR